MSVIDASTNGLVRIRNLVLVLNVEVLTGIKLEKCRSYLSKSL